MFNPHLRQVQSGQIPQGLVQSSLQRFHCCSGQHIPVSDLPPGEKKPVFCHVSCLLAFCSAPWKRVWFCFLYILKLSQPFFIYQMAQSLVVLVAFCCTLSNVTVFFFFFCCSGKYKTHHKSRCSHMKEACPLPSISWHCLS